jgi:hypothetical protein
MIMQIEITPKRVRILYKMYTQKMPVGTVSDMTKAIEGSNWSSDTYSFLNDCVILSILTLENTVWIRGREYPVYRVDKERLAKFWMQRHEYLLSLEIIKDEYAIVI